MRQPASLLARVETQREAARVLARLPRVRKSVLACAFALSVGPAGVRGRTRDRSIRRHRRRAWPERVWRRATAVVLLVALTSSPRGPRAEEPASTPETVAKLLQEIEDLQARLPRERFDPAPIAAEAGGDPARTLEWLRANTRLVPYEGSLRGPLGVLMDRSGNSLDRSLLLAHLLELAGFEARVVGARLPSADMLTVLSGNSRPLPEPPPEEETEGRNRKELSDQAASIAKMILARTGPLSPAAPAVESTHYWVQLSDGTAWVDLDPTLPEPGRSRARPEGAPLTLDPVTHSLPRPVDGGADLSHSVTLRLVVERWEAGKLVESPLLSVTFQPSHGPLGSATLTFVPVDQKAGKAVQRSFATGAELRRKLLLETAWAPILADGRTGGRIARMFNDAGIVGDLPKAFDGAAEMGNAARVGFGGLLGGVKETAEDPTVLTALFADYEIHVPGRPAGRVRRSIFDSIGPEVRRSTEAIPRPRLTQEQRIDRGAELAALNDTLVAFASLSPDAYIYRFAQRVIDSKQAALKAANGSVDDATLERAASGRSFRTLELFAAARDSSMGPDLVVAEPQIFRRLIRYVPDENAEALDVQVFGDLAWNRLAAAGGTTHPAASVAQGVLDTLEESVIVFRDTPALPGQTTAALLAEAVKQGIDIVALRDAGDPHFADFPGPARARMLDDLEAGQILVAPSRPLLIDGQPRLGWWRIEPSSAQTVGAMDTGLLQAFVEYSETQEVNGVRIVHFRKMRVGPAAREWATHMMRQRSSTSWNQWLNLLRYAQQNINSTGLLPPW